MKPLWKALTLALVALLTAHAVGLAASGDGRTIKDPIILVPGAFGSWSQSAWEAMVRNITTNKRTGLDYVAAQVMNATAKAGIKDRVARSLSVDAAKPPEMRRHVIDYKAAGLDHQGDSVWYLEPVDGSYSGFLDLLCGLKAEGGLGLKPNQDVFVFCYDTVTESLQNNGAHLARFVDGVLAKTGADRVQLVTHSQGGLVSRYYIQSLNGSSKVGNLVLTATPSHGAVAAYDVAKSGEYTTANDTFISAMNSMMKKDPSTPMGLRFDPSGDPDIAMDVLLWMMTGLMAKDRQAWLRGIEEGHRADGQISTLYAMLPQFDFVLQGRTGVKQGIFHNAFLEQVMNTPEAMVELAKVPHVAVVISPGTKTAEYMMVKDRESQADRLAVPEAFGSGYGAAYTSLGDGSVLIKSAELPELGAVAREGQYRLREELQGTPHNGYFKSAKDLIRWLPQELLLEPAAP